MDSFGFGFAVAVLGILLGSLIWALYTYGKVNVVKDRDYNQLWRRFAAGGIDWGVVAVVVSVIEGITGGAGNTEMLFIALLTLYYAVLEGVIARPSVGKTLIGFEIIALDGQSLGTLRRNIRPFAYIFGLVFFLGSIWLPLLTAYRQNYPDIVTGSLVVRRSNANEAEIER